MPVTAFIQWTDALERKHRDIETVLRERVEERKPDLTAEDAELSEDAADEISEIFDHLSGPLPPLPKAERQKLALNAIQDESLSAAERRKLRKRVQRATGRPRGRPRNEASQQAIKALTLHLDGEKWEAIAATLRGCKHLCSQCGADRQTAIRLEPGRVPAMSKARLRTDIRERSPLRRWEQVCPKCGSVPPKSPKLACRSCVESIRTAVGRLEHLLQRIGYDLAAVPRMTKPSTN